MTQANIDYSQLSAQSRATAAEQVLENVRQKHLTAAASWDRLAHANEKMERMRMSRLAKEAAALSLPAGTAGPGIAWKENRDEH
jgi:hypothetical protein